MGRYWAKIELPEKITFYTEVELKKMGFLDELKMKQDNYKIYKKRVNLTPKQIEILKKAGVEVQLQDFFALDGVWHWFTGHWHMDAFRFTPEIKQLVDDKGYFEVKFTYGED